MGYEGILKDFKGQMSLGSHPDQTKVTSPNIPKYPLLSPNIPKYLLLWQSNFLT